MPGRLDVVCYLLEQLSPTGREHQQRAFVGECHRQFTADTAGRARQHDALAVEVESAGSHSSHHRILTDNQSIIDGLVPAFVDDQDEWVTTGAHVVLDRLFAGGVDVCFANPGTSEMHFVAALDDSPGMRSVLCPFEGVASGAADGYARIAGKPAATLLHLGPGMANGLANLHNARRAGSPVVNVVGDHATYHQKFDAPLQSDIDALGHWLTGTVHRPASSTELAVTVDRAIAAATLGRIATLILPADVSWSEAEPAAAEALPLTTREQEIIRLLSQGYTTREIAERLTVSTRTVEGHVYRVMTKLGPSGQGPPALMSPATSTSRASPTY